MLITTNSSLQIKLLLFYLKGFNASQEEITTATNKINKIDDEFGQVGFQARIIQGRETPHFLQLFKGKLTIFKGQGTDYDGNYLFQYHLFDFT